MNDRIYHILVDRFSTGSDELDSKLSWNYEIDFMGGKIKGITSRLDYIKDLGFNAIYLSPIFRGNDYHGYHVIDFYSIDEHFGNELDFKKLISAAHAKGIKVILDFVPNHVHYTHNFFQKARMDKGSKYRDWFVWKNNEYLCFHTCKWLPKLNTKNRKVQEYLLDVARYYLELGVDGFRVDHAYGLAPEFAARLKDLIIELKGRNAHYFGECWVDPHELKNPRIIQTLWLLNKSKLWAYVNKLKYSLAGDKFRFIQNLREKIYNELAEYFLGLLDFYTCFILREKIFNANEFVEWVLRARELSSKLNLYKFVDNHDMERYFTVVNYDMDLVKIGLATIYLCFTNPVIIYYGTEIPLGQPRRFPDFGDHKDVLARIFMPWNAEKRLASFIKLLNRIKASMISSNINVVSKPGLAILANIKTKNGDYIAVINASRKHVELDGKYLDIENDVWLRYVPPLRVKIFEVV